MFEGINKVANEYRNYLASKGLSSDFKTNGFIIDAVSFFDTFNPKLFVSYPNFTSNIINPLSIKIDLNYDIYLIKSYFSSQELFNTTYSIFNNIIKKSLDCLKIEDELFKFLVDVYPNYVELIDEWKFGPEEDKWAQFWRENPNYKLYYPEPYIASPSFNHEEIWFLHILHFQYWLWFLFISIIMFYFVTFIAVVRWCNVRVKPRRETRGVSRSKCADLITATIPLTWALSILISESFDAVDYNDGFGTGELVIGIRAYQWGWEYYYPKTLDIQYNVTPSYSALIGNSLKYSNTSTKNTTINDFWKFYQNSRKTSSINTPSNILLAPLDKNNMVNLMQIKDIGINKNDAIGAFRKSSRRTRSQPQHLFTNFSEFSSRYNKINSLYLSDINLNESANYGFDKQHNFTSKHSLFNSSRTLIEDKAVKTFIKYNTNLDYNNLLHQSKKGRINYNPLSSSDELPKNNFNNISGNNLSTKLELLNHNYVKASKGFGFSYNIDSKLNSNFITENPLPSLSNHESQYFKAKRIGFTEINAKTLINKAISLPMPAIKYFSYTPAAQGYYPIQSKAATIIPHLTPSEIAQIIPTFKDNNKEVLLSQLNYAFNRKGSMGDGNFKHLLNVTNMFSNFSLPKANVSDTLNDLEITWNFSHRLISGISAINRRVNFRLPTHTTYVDYAFLAGPESKRLNNTFNNIIINKSIMEPLFNSKMFSLHSFNTGPVTKMYSLFDKSIVTEPSYTTNSLILNLSNPTIILSSHNNSNVLFYDINSTQFNHEINTNTSNQEISHKFFKNHLDASLMLLTTMEGEDEYVTSSKVDSILDEIIPSSLFINNSSIKSSLGKGYRIEWLKEYPTFDLSKQFLNVSNTYPASPVLNDLLVDLSMSPVKNLQTSLPSYLFDRMEDLYADIKMVKSNFNLQSLSNLNTDINFTNFMSYRNYISNFTPKGLNYNSLGSDMIMSSVNNSKVFKSFIDIFNYNNVEFTDNISLLPNAKALLANIKALRNVMHPRADEMRSFFSAHDISSSYTKLPFYSEKDIKVKALLGKNKVSYLNYNFYKKKLNTSINPLTNVWNSLHSKTFEMPFLVGIVNEATKNVWFDWYSRYNKITTAPSDFRRFSFMGISYTNKGFDFEPALSDEIKESEDYITKLAHSRRNYLPGWSASAYLYHRANNWYKMRLHSHQYFEDLTNTHSMVGLLFYFYNLEFDKTPSTIIPNFTDLQSEQTFTKSGTHTKHKSFWRPISNQAAQSYVHGKLSDLMAKRERLYRLFLSKQWSYYTFPQEFVATPTNPLFKAVKASVPFVNPAVLTSEAHRDIWYQHSKFLKLIILKDFLININHKVSTLPINADKITSFLIYKFFQLKSSGPKYDVISNNYKSQYRPMRKGITNMIKLHTTAAVAMPTEIRLHIVASSKDVIHSWAIPSAGIKIDCIPGYSSHRITIFLVSGVFWGQCMEVCGRFHHWMPIVVYFMRRDLFFLWCTHFVHYTSMDEMFAMTDKQLINHARVISHSTSEWVKELAYII